MKKSLSAKGRIPFFSGLLFTFIFSSFVFSASAENILTITNPDTKETEVFRKGSFLVFELKSDKSVREGFIQDISDSSLRFEDSQVSLSQINVLAGSTKAKIVAGRVLNGIGGALVIAGTTVFDCGLEFLATGDGGYYYWPIGGSIWLAGAFIAGLGYAFDWASTPLDHTVRVRNYKGWSASIIDEDKIPAQTEEKPKEEKIIPHVDGTVRICELVTYNLEDVTIKDAWTGPAALELHPHALAPVADLPVLKIKSATHILTDMTLPYGKVILDYL